MKNKAKVIFLSLMILSAFSLGRSVNAANASLYISPDSGTKNSGSNFSISARVSPLGVKTCVVKGTLVFNNLSCRSITVADGIMAQSMPSCSNPHFMLGIPTCTTSDKSLFAVSVKAGSPGQASINFTGAGIIGVGVLVSSDSAGGNYTIKAVPVPKNEETPQPGTTTSNEENNEINNGQTQQSQNGQNISPETGTGGEGNQEAAIEKVGFMKAVEQWVSSNILWLVILILLLIIAYLIYQRMREKMQDKEKK